MKAKKATTKLATPLTDAVRPLLRPKDPAKRAQMLAAAEREALPLLLLGVMDWEQCDDADNHAVGRILDAVRSRAAADMARLERLDQLVPEATFQAAGFAGHEGAVEVAVDVYTEYQQAALYLGMAIGARLGGVR